MDADADVTLQRFLHYRRAQLTSGLHSDTALLLTATRFQHGVVGKALKGTICTREFSGEPDICFILFILAGIYRLCFYLKILSKFFLKIMFGRRCERVGGLPGASCSDDGARAGAPAWG